MAEVIVFAGTTEGYSIGRFLERHKIPSVICTATEYGASLVQGDDLVTVRAGRMDADQMTAFFSEENPRLVIDATHPYADLATENIRNACKAAAVSYIRVLRSEGGTDCDEIRAATAGEAAEFLSGTSGNILVTTGSKELAVFTGIPDFQKRVYARVLPLPGVLESCLKLGFGPDHLICMQGPFSMKMNAAMLRQYNCSYLVTKDSGAAGGFQEKIGAARECGASAVVIGRPVREEGITVFECRRLLCREFDIRPKPEISLIGAGMGSEESMTVEAKRVLAEAELVIGARRITDAVRTPGQDVYYEYQSEKIAAYIEEHCEYEKIAVVFSGDTGFYSGARKVLDALHGSARVICGVSCVSWFMAKIGMAWDDAVLISCHGRNGNLVNAIAGNPKVFAILGTADGVGKLAGKLVKYGLGNVLLYVGERLSYPDEKIFSARAFELTGYQGDPLSVVAAVNENAAALPCTPGIPDACFIRDQVPMTKEEIRMVSLCKLQPKRNSVCYDVGAGTGSVSVELARLACDGVVYAVEKNGKALELIEKNKNRFCTDNVIPVSGSAPDALRDLPVPDRVFIGGSSGEMREIIHTVLGKNPAARMVINCITLETLGQVLTVAGEMQFEVFDVVQISAARSKTAGHYHMMNGENPVYVITLQNPEHFSGQEDTP